MKMQTVVVYEKDSKEIVACIPLSGEQAICRNDVNFQIYNGTEPIFTETQNGIVFNENILLLSNSFLNQ